MNFICEPAVTYTRFFSGIVIIFVVILYGEMPKNMLWTKYCRSSIDGALDVIDTQHVTSVGFREAKYIPQKHTTTKAPLTPGHSSQDNTIINAIEQ